MITIVTGKKDSGKTSKLCSIFESQKGGGFLSTKIFVGRIFLGYDVLNLLTGEKRPFIRRIGFLPSGWTEKVRTTQFSFSAGGFDFAERSIDQAIRMGVGSLFLDEVGAIELQQKGFHDLLHRVFNLKRQIFVAVRDVYVPEVIDKFDIVDFTVLSVDP